MADYIKQKPDGSYHAVLRIPKDLMETYAPKQFKQRALKGVSSRREACDLARESVVEWKKEFGKVRSGIINITTAREGDRGATFRTIIPTEAEMRNAVIDVMDDFLYRYQIEEPRDQSRKIALNWIKKTKAILDDPDNTHETDVELVNDLIDKKGWAINEGMPEYAVLNEKMLRVQLQAARVVANRSDFDFSDEITDRQLVRPKQEELPAKEGEQILDLFADYLSESNLGGSTGRSYRQAIRWFVDFVGEMSVPEKAFTRQNASRFKKMLKLAPVNAGSVKELKKLKFPQLIEANKSLGRNTISDRTVNKILTACNSFAAWLELHAHINERDVFGGLLLDIDIEATKYLPFDNDQLETLFNSPLFTGALSDEKPGHIGNVKIRDHRYWLWLLGLFTGARLGEMALLIPQDIYVEDEVHYIQMPTEKKKRGKIVIPARNVPHVVPVHSKLINLGFLDFVKAAVGNREDNLFSKIRPAADGHLTSGESKQLNGYLLKIGVKTKTNQRTFHSTRSTFIQSAEKGGVSRYNIDLLIKNGATSVTGRHYGGEQEGTHEQRAEWMSNVVYPGLDLSHLYPTTQ